MVINIFYICTGEYKRFFDKFYLSCEDKFIPEFEKNIMCLPILIGFILVNI
ncbi:Uncharacterised protein [Escherichia coli]|nr:Uncharacterised protein [Escherichia coli]